MATAKSAVVSTASEAPSDVATQEKKAVESLPMAYTGLPSLPKTFDDAVEAMEDFYGAELASFNPYPLLNDKSKLIGLEFVIERFDFIYKKDKAGNVTDEVSYVNVKAMTRQGNKRFAFNDGGTGICRSLIEFAARTGRDGGIKCPLGLRVSEYETADGGDAQTFYLN